MAEDNVTNNTVDYSTDDHISSSVNIEKIVFLVVYFLIFIAALPGNILTCYKLCRTKLLLNVANIYMFSLSSASILMCLFTVPITPIYAQMRKWVFGDAICHLFPFTESISIYVFTLTSLAISKECYNAILSPKKMPTTIRKEIATMAVIWVLSILASLPVAIYASAYEFDTKTICVWLWTDDYNYSIFALISVGTQYIIPFILTIYYTLRVRFRLCTNHDVRCPIIIVPPWFLYVNKIKFRHLIPFINDQEDIGQYDVVLETIREETK
ncbi:hypothetical protein CHUAL_008348 [Chamberlinius hualienensis]